MNKKEIIGANIRSLRNAYDETQEELGEALNVEKTAISNYETGKREPDREMLTNIAKHFMVSVEELTKCDLSDLQRITVDNKAFLKNISIILPIAMSEDALKNKHFNEAYRYHKKVYDKLRENSMDGIEHVAICFEEYLEAYKEENIKPEAAANFWTLWNLTLLMFKTAPLAIKNRSAALMQVAERDSELRQVIDDPDSDFENDAKEAVSILEESGMAELMDELRITVKKSSRWADLADYYLAMQYIWNFVDNEMDWEFNRKVGVEMLNAYVSVGNIYAARYLVFCRNSMGLSSQTVDDK